jgi:hypothetical protein
VANDATLAHVRPDVSRREVPDEAFDLHTRRGRSMHRARTHFEKEASKCLPFEGDLEELDREYRARLAVRKKDTVESNPFADPEDAQQQLC